MGSAEGLQIRQVAGLEVDHILLPLSATAPLERRNPCWRDAYDAQHIFTCWDLQGVGPAPLDDVDVVSCFEACERWLVPPRSYSGISVFVPLLGNEQVAGRSWHEPLRLFGPQLQVVVEVHQLVWV
ncbi:hypothetical protein Vretifemale_12329 [Volvox reticuliferus]|uniref:Uncharacterized protein n=1 Tax=Volvox reticuliferus TaxID=1737510 RepID=A0A8J4FNF2_9CHLO|nr:hypothetical protein Vretifemale_12329 [Volvox reticuliferus]